MRTKNVLGLVFFCVTALSSSIAQVAPTDRWFALNDLYPIPLLKQNFATPGTLIALLPNGTIGWYHTADVIKPYPLSFDAPAQQIDEAINVGVLAKFLSVGLGGKVTNDRSIGVKQARFEGIGWDDDQGEREAVILQKDTPTVKQFEAIQDTWSKVDRSVPVYFIQRVYSTAELDITDVENVGIGIAANKDVPKGCTSVKEDDPKTQTASAPAKPQQGPSPGATPTPPPTLLVTDEAPGGSLEICKGKGGRLTLKADHKVPVAMNVCHIYYWEEDKSWNCEGVAKTITFPK